MFIFIGIGIVATIFYYHKIGDFPFTLFLAFMTSAFITIVFLLILKQIQDCLNS